MEIRTSVFSGDEKFYTQFPWEGRIDGIQGGTRGIVIVRGTKDAYRTAFVEMWGGEIDFIRGEGSTIADAEKSAWEKFLKHTSCKEHEYETRGYKNGVGFCKHCGYFGSKVFTAEQLGLTCDVCGIYANYSMHGEEVYCKEHAPDLRKIYPEVFGDMTDEEYYDDEDEDEES